MGDLLVRLKREPDGSAALSCRRADGSVTWQRQKGQYGQFFPVHDLTHYAVESVLTERRGFFGLIADGWEIKDFAPPFPRGPIPTDARAVELIVSMIDTGRLSAARWTAAEFREQAELYVASRRSAGKQFEDLPVVSDEELEKIRALRGKLVERWSAMRAGEALELVFGGAPSS